MTHLNKVIVRSMVVALLAAATAQLAQAGLPPSGGEFVVRRSTIDAGGGSAAGGDFTLKGTVGQSDTVVASGDMFTLRSGFWTPSGVPDLIFSDSFE